jgi:hypothetical protein
MSKVVHVKDGIEREISNNALDYGDGTVMIEYKDDKEIAIVLKSELEVRPS